jgi:hypothetical protein
VFLYTDSALRVGRRIWATMARRLMTADRWGARIRRTVVLTTVAWALMLARGSFLGVGEALVALGIACVVPLGAALAGDRDAAGEHRVSFVVAACSLPIAAPLGLASFLLPVGGLAGAAAAAWLVATLLIGTAGAARIARRGLFPIEELAIDAGHLYLPVGGIWLLASRSGHPLLGFQEPIVLYTAAHFHFAGFAAPVVMGLVGRELHLRRAPDRGGRDGSSASTVAGPMVRRIYAIATAIVLAGIPLVAAGIQVSRSLERPSAILLGAGMFGASALLVIAGTRRLVARARASGGLLIVSGASLVLSMTFAVLFAVTSSATRGSDAPWIPYSQMALIHGIANAGGFATVALVAFSLSPPACRVGPFGGSWPKLFGGWFVGPDFFDRSGAIDTDRVVRGQLGSLDDFGHRSFEPSRVHPAVRDFYENTAAYELHVEPDWHVPFRIGGRIFAVIARRMLGNLELPTERGANPDDLVATRLFGVRADRDGRAGGMPRGYVRTLASGGSVRANYVAVYSTHVTASGETLLSSAFPLPFSSLLGVLRFDDGPPARAGSLTLSSRPRAGEGPSDEGMFLVTALLPPLRLPVNEQLEVWFDGELRARHDVHVLGLHAFTLSYTMSKTA